MCRTPLSRRSRRKQKKTLGKGVSGAPKFSFGGSGLNATYKEKRKGEGKVEQCRVGDGGRGEHDDERGRRLVGDIEATRAVEGPDLDPEDSHRRPLNMDARFRRKSAGADLT